MQIKNFIFYLIRIFISNYMNKNIEYFSTLARRSDNFGYFGIGRIKKCLIIRGHNIGYLYFYERHMQEMVE